MRTRLHQVLALSALFAASATASPPLLAADLPPPPLPVYGEAPLPPQDVFEGWYLGGTIGGATVSFDSAPAGTTDTSGVLGGAVGGYSWQGGPFVIGVEADLLAADINGTRNFNAGLNRMHPSIDTMADLRLRAGYTITPQVLLFGTFGGAWANADLPVTGPGGASGSADFFGWSGGGGAEVALNPNWSARFDYQFTDFDSETVKYPGGKIDYDPDASTYRGSLIYRF
ncbi:MAG TPA: outer membrane beta-barrel protein [Alphaproteobacteria bacterium]|nr:outer membrane beta-barrel protein [Alphaproteobacteria bacterium]